MSLAPPPPLLRRAFRLSAAAAGQSRALAGRVATRGRRLGSVGRAAYCVFSSAGDGGRRKQESSLELDKTGFERCGVVESETKLQRGRRGGPCLAAGGGGGRSGARRGGAGGGSGGWFGWFISGGFWDAAKQTVLTILGIVAVFFLIANFNVLIGAAVYPLLLVLRQIRRAITFAAYCVSRSMSTTASRPKATPVGSSEVAPTPVKGRVGMSARERVVSKWGSD